MILLLILVLVSQLNAKGTKFGAPTEGMSVEAYQDLVFPHYHKLFLLKNHIQLVYHYTQNDFWGNIFERA